MWSCFLTAGTAIIPHRFLWNRKRKNEELPHGNETYERDGILNLKPCSFKWARKSRIRPNTIRLSVGTEHIDDILQDLEEAFKAVEA